MNAVRFFITLAFLVACVFAAEKEQAREKRFPLAYSAGLYHGGYGGYGLGYGAAYGAYPYSAGYAGYHHYSPVAYSSGYHYPSYGYHGLGYHGLGYSHGYHYPSYYGAHSLYHY